MSKIILFIAISQDSFIADKNGDVDWLPQPKNDAELAAVGYKDLISRIDTILMGSVSYQQIVSFGHWAWPDKQTYVFTSQAFELESPYITTTPDSPFEVISRVRELKSQKDMWWLGGARLAQSFAKENLIDEVILTITPYILGQGILLGLNFDNFEFVKEKSLMHGMIQKFYKKREC